MKLVKKFMLFKLWLLIAIPMNVWPQAQPVPQPDLINRMISGVLQDGMRSRGFAANDPRFANTIARATPYLVSAAATGAAIVAGTVSAPAWASAALAIGVGSVVNYAVGLGLDSLVKWFFRADRLVDQQIAPFAPQPSTCVMTAGGGYAYANFGSIAIKGCNSEAVGRQRYALAAAQDTTLPKFPATCQYGGVQGWLCGGLPVYSSIDGAPQTCPGGTYSNGTQCVGYTYLLPGTAATAVSPQAAINQIPASDLGLALNPAVSAALANRLWQQTAAQTGYDGVPYPVSNPITPAEVTAWTTANPTVAPTVRDFVAPNPTTAANSQPWAIPAIPISTQPVAAVTPNANTVNPAAANPLQNLGPDPGTPAPTLESTPTAQAILAPILSMLPNLRSFNVTSHSSACPKPTVSLVGKTITMDAHCIVIDSIKPILQTAMLFAWAAIALFVILSA